MGTVVSALGVGHSLKIDLPTGVTIVCTFGILLILMALFRGAVRRRADRLNPSPRALSTSYLTDITMV